MADIDEHSKSHLSQRHPLPKFQTLSPKHRDARKEKVARNFLNGKTMPFPMTTFSETAEPLWLKFSRRIHPKIDTEHRKFQPKWLNLAKLKATEKISYHGNCWALITGVATRPTYKNV